MQYLAAFALCLTILAGGVQAQESPPIRYQLPNGLDVVLSPDNRVPKVVLNLSYRVGSMNEPPGRSGFAHLFEHLMFSGTPAVPDIDAAYGAVGVDLNAWTWEDRTLYYAEGLASALPLILSVEADRMANQGIAITADDLDLQRNVVLNEMRETVLDAPSGAGWEAMRTALFPATHPYSRSVIGSIADLEAADIEDVHAFFDTYYTPNNAILVLVGDFDVDHARSLIADTFGLVARGPSVVPPVPAAVPPVRARLAFEDRVPAATIAFGWTAPPFASPDLGALRLASELLGNIEYGVLRKALVDTGLATTVSAWLERSYLGSRFFIEVSAADGIEPAVIEGAVRAAVAGFIDCPVDVADLQRARKRILLGDRVSLEPLRARAEQIALYTEMLDAPDAALTDEAGVVDATADGVRGVVRRLLDPADASVMVIRPGERGGYPPVLTESSGVAAPFAPAQRPSVAVPVLEAEAPVSAPMPVSQTATLSNGIRVVHYQTPAAPLAYVAARSSAGVLSAPEGKEGLIELAATMGPRGAGDLGPEAFGKAAKDLGADIDFKADDIATFMILQTAPESLRPAVALFAEALRRPLFDAHEWEIAVAETLNELRRREGDLPDLAGRAVEAAIFPKQPGEAAIDRSIASVSAIGLDDAKAAYARIFAPGSVSFYSVGPEALAELVEALEAHFADWAVVAPDPFPPVVRRAATFPDRPRLLLVPEPGASQSALALAVPAPGFDEPGRAAAAVVFRLLAYDFISRLNAVIREEKGFSYGTDGELVDAVRKGSAMVVETTVSRENTGAALTELFNGFRSLADDPVHPDELERSVRAMYAILAGISETAGSLFDEVWGQMSRGSSLEEEYARRIAITHIGLAEVRRQARAMASLDHAVIAAAGDPDVVLPQLEALGFDVEIVDRGR